MSLRATVIVSLLGVGALLALLLATHEASVGTRADGQPRWRHVLEDVHDRNVYQQRGRWLPGGRVPYVEEHSEYPQLATLLFGLPYVFFESHVPQGRQQTTQELRQHPEDSAAYFDLHHVSMALSLAALLVLTALLLAELGAGPGRALLLLLPASAYYAFNRFDAWPAACVAAALLAQFRGRLLWAAAWLGIGAMFKWYPALLVPLFLAHNLHGRGERRPLLARLPGAVLAPGLVAGGTCLAVLALTWFWGDGGWAAVRYVYGFHGGRDPNPGSIVYALTTPRRWGVLGPGDSEWLGRVATALQFLPALLLALAPVRSRRALVLGCLTVVLAFMQFGKVWSPQWIVWVTPLALLASPGSRAALLLLVASELLVYVQTPLLYYESVGNPAHPDGSAAYWAVSSARIACLALFWAWSLAAFLRTVGRAEGDPGRGPAAGPGG
ncbi:MAG: DUF2029 domain-containing protein [Planctomycetes bacterium]|nr:DUF2029 domain-containing protein [Planctomycetota bacterium]